MGQNFLGEIKIMSFGFAPQGWAQCNGQLLPINQSQALFSLLGTTYGGNGQTTFALPDLRGSTPIHFGKHVLGERTGEENHTLSISEMPLHVHALNGTTAAASQIIPGAAMLGTTAATDPIYGNPTSLVAMDPTSISNTGGGQAHLNMQPFLTLNFCIALQGIFPSRN
jgi:microcystin-dependent protein